MKKIYQKVKKPAIKILAGATVLFGLQVELHNSKIIGGEIYRGPIGGYDEVVYEEGRLDFSNKKSFNKNTMIIKKGDIKFYFEDIENETDIDWENEKIPDFSKDGLEKVIVTANNEGRTIKVNEINSENLEGMAAGRIFEMSNKMYNNLRTQIREKLRSDYQERINSFERKFE